jgi:hypothetical protein
MSEQWALRRSRIASAAPVAVGALTWRRDGRLDNDRGHTRLAIVAFGKRHSIL